MLKGLIFDLDGVIVDSHPAHKLAWKMFLDGKGRRTSSEELEFVVEGHTREDILRHFLGALSLDQVCRYGAEKDALFNALAREIRMIHGLEEFLQQVETEKLPMAVGSSASRGRVDAMLQHLCLSRRFAVVVTGNDVTKGKPDPAIFQAAADKLGLSAENILVCEDAECGVEAAKRAGMKCLAIAANGRAQCLEKAGADRIITDFTATSIKELRLLFAS